MWYYFNMKKYLYLYICALIAAFGGLLSGFDTGVISGALLYINESFPLSEYTSGLLVSAVSLGAILGAFVNGFFVDIIGRRKMLVLTAGLFFLASVFCFFSQNIVQLILSRALIGVAVGIVSFCGPLYLGEISPKEKRGQIVSLHQLAITFGILFSYLINFFCANLELNWRIMFLAGVIPSLILFIGLLFEKDTPRWYMIRNRVEDAKRALRLTLNKEDVDEEIEDISKTLQKDHKIAFSKKLLLPFIIGLGIMAVQQLTGINAIIYYAPTIFKSIGFASNQSALLITIFIGLINFLMTFVALALVDKLGRKPLLYIGLSGMLSSLLVMSFVFVSSLALMKYLAIVFCAIYIISFSMSLGPVAFILVSEVFPLRYRANAMSLAIVTNFLFNFFVSGLFPLALSKIGGFYTFMIFAFICVLGLLFVKFVVFETKGVSLEEIELENS